MNSPFITINKPLSSFSRQEVSLPGSKYIANRILIIAALADGISTLHNMPDNQDIKIASQGIRALGAEINRSGNSWQIQGINGRIRPRERVYTGENGTFSRFVVAMSALSEEKVNLDSAPRMKERPMGDILQALKKLGATIEGETFPLTIAGPLHAGVLSLKGNVSSQFFSALALALPYARMGERTESRISISTPLVSKNYLLMTLELMRAFGVTAQFQEEKNRGGNLIIPSGHYSGKDYTLEADPVSATYFMGLAALSSESLIIQGYNPSSSQGDYGFPQILKKMGCEITQVNNGQMDIKVSPPLQHKLKGIEVDMSNLPDAVPTLAVLASTAVGKTRINGIAHLRYKESNRVEDTATELIKAGIKVKTGTNFMDIEGGNPCPALFDSHNDHRLAMSLSLLCLRCQEVKIKNYQCVGKSFPDYFNKLQELGFRLNQ